MPGYARHVGACYVLVFRVEAKCKLKVGKCAKENSFSFSLFSSFPATTQRIDGGNIHSVHAVYIYLYLCLFAGYFCKLFCLAKYFQVIFRLK